MKKYAAIFLMMVSILLLSSCKDTKDDTLTQLTREPSAAVVQTEPTETIIEAETTGITVQEEIQVPQSLPQEVPRQPLGEPELTEPASGTMPVSPVVEEDLHQPSIPSEPPVTEAASEIPSAPVIHEVTGVLTPIRPSEATPTEPTPTEPTPTEPTPTEATPTEPIPTEPTPIDPEACNLPWGVKMTAQNVTSTGLTVLCTNTSDKERNGLETGSYYVLQRWNGTDWEEAPRLPGCEELYWTMEARLCFFVDEADFDVSWKNIYGTLPDGKYRVGKEFDDPEAEKVTFNMYYIPFSIDTVSE